MRRVSILAAAIALACISAPPALSSFPVRPGAAWSENCCGRPIVEKEPQYPVNEVRGGQSGWVIVSGILDERGWVTDPIVLASEPEGVFDKAALVAFDEWRYAALSSDPAAKREVRAILRFNRPRPASAMPSGGAGPSGGGGQPGY